MDQVLYPVAKIRKHRNGLHKATHELLAEAHLALDLGILRLELLGLDCKSNEGANTYVLHNE